MQLSLPLQNTEEEVWDGTEKVKWPLLSAVEEASEKFIGKTLKDVIDDLINKITTKHNKKVGERVQKKTKNQLQTEYISSLTWKTFVSENFRVRTDTEENTIYFKRLDSDETSVAPVDLT